MILDKERIKISVIIPTFKPDNYLLDCLMSLNSQTLDKSLYEVIIVLNGEKEPYTSSIKDWISNMSFFSKFLYSEQKGVSNARNLGIEKAAGKYIAFIDDDDYVSPQYLHSLFECIESNPDGTIVCSDVRTFDSNKVIGTDYISHAYSKATNDYKKNTLLNCRSFMSSSCCKLIPISVIDKGRFDSGVRLGEDSLFMALISSRIKKITTSSIDAIYYRRLRTGSASRGRETLPKRISRKINLINKLIIIYLKGFPQYNTLFFLTRIIAVTIK